MDALAVEQLEHHLEARRVGDLLHPHRVDADVGTPDPRLLGAATPDLGVLVGLREQQQLPLAHADRSDQTAAVQRQQAFATSAGEALEKLSET